MSLQGFLSKQELVALEDIVRVFHKCRKMLLHLVVQGSHLKAYSFFNCAAMHNLVPMSPKISGEGPKDSDEL